MQAYPVVDVFNKRWLHRDHPRGKNLLDMRPHLVTRDATYLVANTVNLANLMVVDVDAPDALDLVLTRSYDDGTLPEPNFAVVNLGTTHAHVGWFIEEPVTTSIKARMKPQRFLDAVARTLTVRADGDEAYTGALLRSPYAPGHSFVPLRRDSWDLDSLRDALGDLEPLKPSRRSARPLELGRNVHLFDVVRFWAYGAKASAHNYDSFAAEVMAHTWSVNQSFPSPLPASEVRATARSVARWTWTRYQGEGSQGAKQAAAKSAEVRIAKKVSNAEKARAMRDMGLGVQEIMDTLMVSRRTVFRYLKEA